MPVTKGCTSAMLYNRLAELGVDPAELRKKKASFAELEKLYLDLLNKKLAERHKHLHRSRYF